MKLSQGFKKWKTLTLLSYVYITSFAALTLAIKGMELSMVYAIWSGIGTILIAIISIFVFDESMSFTKII